MTLQDASTVWINHAEALSVCFFKQRDPMFSSSGHVAAYV